MNIDKTLEPLGISTTKIGSKGTERAIIMRQNTALKILAGFLVCCLGLVIVWAGTQQALTEKRILASQTTMMAANSAKLDALKSTDNGIEAQAFTKQNIRALQGIKVGTSHMHRILSKFKKTMDKLAKQVRLFPCSFPFLPSHPSFPFHPSFTPPSLPPHYHHCHHHHSNNNRP
jgi:hypothetical protein